MDFELMIMDYGLMIMDFGLMIMDYGLMIMDWTLYGLHGLDLKAKQVHVFRRGR